MKTKIALLVSLIVFAMTTCSNDVDEDWDETLLEINFGQEDLPNYFKYEIKVDGPTILTETSVGTQPVRVKVSVGDYNISVTAFSDDIGGTEQATGNGKITVRTGLYSINITLNRSGGVDTPIAIPGAGTYTGLQNIILFTTTTGAEIRYTLDGSEPNSSSNLYSTPITISDLGIKTLKAIAFMSGLLDSLPLTVEYNILPEGKVATPVANPPGRMVISGTTVELTTTIGAEIWYTTNGSSPAPSAPSIKYVSPISITAAMTIKAIAVKAGWTDSDMLEAKYTLLSIDMVPIPAGTFWMGSSDGSGNPGNPSPPDGSSDDDEQPRHEVTLTGFSMGKYQVTQEQYLAVMGSNPSNFQSNPATGEIQEKRPVEWVSWYDALVFCNKLSLIEGLTPAYSINGSTNPDDWGPVPESSDATWNAVQIVGSGYRLPTEAQWEYACMALTESLWVHGDEESGLENYAWYSVNSDSMTHEVGKKTANAWGLYDMHGNVLEWCWDRYGNYSSEAQIDPLGATTGSSRVLRGGSWYSASSYNLRSAYRAWGYPYYRYYDSLTGLRVVRP